MSNIDEEIIKLCSAAKEFRRRRWCEGTGGNFSVVHSHNPLTVHVTQSGVDKGALQPHHFLVLDANGEVQGQPTGKPSAEAKLHVEIAKATGCKAILHVHTLYNTLLGMRYQTKGEIFVEGFEVEKALPGVSSHLQRVRIPVIRNSQDMETLSQHFLQQYEVQTDLCCFLVAGHGVYTWGSSVEKTRNQLEALEFLFSILWQQILAPSP